MPDVSPKSKELSARIKSLDALGLDAFLAVVLMLAPWVAPLPAYALLTFSAFLQTFIFMILTYVYLAGAVLISEEH